jgi:HEPN domain-containing protein
MSEKLIQNWYSLAEYDIESARIMLDTGRNLYLAFMCQQAIEKTLKGIFLKQTQQTPPYTHNLHKLAKQLDFYEKFGDVRLGQIEELNAYYIESRYTETLKELTSAISNKKAKDIYDYTIELLKWLETFKK